MFIVSMGVSGRLCAELTLTLKIDDGCASHMHCFEILGLLPSVVVPDNIKPVAIGPSRQEPVLYKTTPTLVTKKRLSALERAAKAGRTTCSREHLSAHRPKSKAVPSERTSNRSRDGGMEKTPRSRCQLRTISHCRAGWRRGDLRGTASRDSFGCGAGLVDAVDVATVVTCGRKGRCPCGYGLTFLARKPDLVARRSNVIRGPDAGGLRVLELSCQNPSGR